MITKIILVAIGSLSKKENTFHSNWMQEQSEMLNSSFLKCKRFPLSNTRSPIEIIKNGLLLRKVISVESPQVIHSLYGSTTLLVSFIGAFGKCPLVVSFCGSDIIPYSEVKFIKKLRASAGVFISLLLSFFVKIIIVKSESLKNRLPNTIKNKVYILPNPVNLERFKPLDRILSREKLNFNTKDYCILFNLGHKGSEYIKQPELAFKTFQRLKNKRNNVHYLIVGDKDSQEVPLYLAAANVLLLTSRYEGSPNIIKEAMAMNLPIVSVNVGDIKERLKNVNPSIVVESFSSTELSIAIDSVLKLKTFSNGREELIRQGLTYDIFHNKLLDIYNNIK